MLRWALRAAACVTVLAGLVFGAAWATVDRYGASRAMVWFEADTDDLHRFPSRPVPAGGPVRPLPDGEPFDLAAAWDLDDPVAHLDATQTAALLIVHDGRLRYEHYADGSGPTELRTSFSAVKSIVSTLVGLAIEDGAIGSVDDPITDYLPELLEHDERFGAITLHDLMTMSSGLAYEERGLPWSDDAQTYYGTDLRATAQSARVAEPPGQAFLYNNYNLLLEGLILERATGRRVSDYLAERLWAPLGAEADATFSLDSERSGFEKMESGFNARPRDYARFGLLFAEAGRVDGVEVVPADWVTRATGGSGALGPNPVYAYHWWTGAPDGTAFEPGQFMALGNFGQYVFVDATRDLVVVRLGDDYGTREWPRRFTQIAAAVDRDVSRGSAGR